MTNDNQTHPYAQIFKEEIASYLSALEEYPGEIFPELVFRLVRELENTFVKAIENEYAFPVLEIGEEIAAASKYLVHPKDISFCILSVLPSPNNFGEDAQFTMANIIDQVEQEHGGAIERLEKKWRWEREYDQQNRSN